jgi:hypothetical protein
MTDSSGAGRRCFLREAAVAGGPAALLRFESLAARTSEDGRSWRRRSARPWTATSNPGSHHRPRAANAP